MWGSNSQPQDQELYALLTEHPRCFFKALLPIFQGVGAITGHSDAPPFVLLVQGPQGPRGGA